MHNVIGRQTHQYDILLKCSVNRVRFGDLSSHCSCAQSSTSGISIFWNSCASSRVICSAISADLRSNSDGGLVITLKIGFIGDHFCCLNTMICAKKKTISKQTIRFWWRKSKSAQSDQGDIVPYLEYCCVAIWPSSTVPSRPIDIQIHSVVPGCVVLGLVHCMDQNKKKLIHCLNH